MINSEFEFSLKDKYTPEYVIAKVLMQISDATHGYVTGVIGDYAGEINTYQKETNGFSMIHAITESQTVTVHTQELLGVQCDTKHRFEVYLTVKGLARYKYRLMFVDYGDISYPVTIVLSEPLARVYNNNSYKDTFSIKSMDQLEDLLEKIFDSDVMHQLIQSLINEALRREMMADTQSEVNDQ